MPLTSTRSPAKASAGPATISAKPMKAVRNMEICLSIWMCRTKAIDTTNDFPPIRHRLRNYFERCSGGRGIARGRGDRGGIKQPFTRQPSLERLVAGDLSIQEAPAPDFQAEKG